MNLPLFLTAYDPTDLPGGSIDPLGFGTAYTALADALLPGLTGAAGEPAYFPALCTAVSWADEGKLGPSRIERRRRRREVALRLERAWGLAVTLHGRAHHDQPNTSDKADKQPIQLRGVTYFQRECERIEQSGAKCGATQFKVLARQSTYGMLGIYANVASRLGLIDLEDYGLTPALGSRLAEAFIEHTLRPAEEREIKRLVLDPNATATVELLRRWGQRCHDPAGWPREAAHALKAGLLIDPERSACLSVLQILWQSDEPWGSELNLMKRALSLLQNGGSSSLSAANKQRLTHLFEASVTLEEAYRWLMVVFERVLWLARDTARQSSGGSVQQDEVLKGCHDQLKPAADRLRQASDALDNVGLHREARRIDDALRFAAAAGVAATPEALVDVVLKRHRAVQHGKYDRGRRKLPWVERQKGLLSITSSSAGGQRGTVTKPEQIPLHAWRMYPALNYLGVIGGEL